MLLRSPPMIVRASNNLQVALEYSHYDRLVRTLW